MPVKVNSTLCLIWDTKPGAGSPDQYRTVGRNLTSKASNRNWEVPKIQLDNMVVIKWLLLNGYEMVVIK